MAITLVATSTGQQTVSTGGSLTINVPTGTKAGDVLFFAVEVNGTNHAPAAPSGLTLSQSAGVSSGPSFGTYYRVCDGTEPASYSFTVATYATGVGRSYRGVDNTTPINASGAPNRSTTSPAGLTGQSVANSITTTMDGCLVIFSAGVGAAVTAASGPTGFGNQVIVKYDGGGSAITSVVTSDETQTSAGATGSESSTLTVSASGAINNWANLTALQAAPAPAPVASSGGDDARWYTAAEMERANRQAEKHRQTKRKPHIALVLDETDWDEEELAFLLALDLLDFEVTDT